jgi:hypothetical protein
MAPKAKAAPAPSKAAAASTSNALVPVGARHLSAKRQTKRDENGDKPTTARALILRNGKHGARGTGEMMLVTKLLGREKLDLLAGKAVLERGVTNSNANYIYLPSRGPRRKIRTGPSKPVPAGNLHQNRRFTVRW